MYVSKFKRLVLENHFWINWNDRKNYFVTFLKSSSQFYFDKGGQARFIDLWRCWTPNQLPLLKGNLLKVMFLSAPSTGKTALMEAKAFQCMQRGMNILVCL